MPVFCNPIQRLRIWLLFLKLIAQEFQKLISNITNLSLKFTYKYQIRPLSLLQQAIKVDQHPFPNISIHHNQEQCLSCQSQICQRFFLSDIEQSNVTGNRVTLCKTLDLPVCISKNILKLARPASKKPAKIKYAINVQHFDQLFQYSIVVHNTLAYQLISINHKLFFKKIQYQMNMQVFLTSFRRHLQRGPDSFKQKHHLRQIILAIAPHISERAYQFTKQLFEVQSIRDLQPLDWTYLIPDPSQSPMCSVVMTEQTKIAAFRCYDCMESSSSCMCQQCFKNGNHQGHNYVQYNSVNGCCDCGNSQAWNQKGFCKTHTAINNLKIELPKSIKEQYVSQGTLLMYIYFFLCFSQQSQQKVDSIYLIELYGQYIFNYFKRISHQSYDMKLLAHYLLDSKLPGFYPKIIHGDLTLLEIFFKVPLEKAKSYQILIHFLFQLFPVQDHRKAVLTNYFKKIKSFDDNMTKENPLAGLNFQYLSCVKLITNMIKTGQLLPLQVFPPNPYIKTNKSIQQIPKLYKKLYQDLDYINNMKSAKDYQMLHFIKTNVAEFAGYREYSKCPVKQDQKDFINQFNVDEFFLKMFGKFVDKLKNQKQVILKGISDLFHYLANTRENAASLAQERAFAMLVFAYFDGQISQLTNGQTKKAFFASIYFNQNHLSLILNQIITKSLKTKINIAKLANPHHNTYEGYFLRLNCQKNIPQFLDCIFYKILIILSQGVCEFDQVVLNFLRSIDDKKYETIEQVIFKEQEKSLERLSQMLVVFELFNSITRTDLDELVIGGLLNIFQKEKIFVFFSRLVATFKQQNAKQLKALCLQFINNQQLFEEFIVKHTIPQKGKLRLRLAVKPLEYFNFNLIFNHISLKLPETQLLYLTGEQQKPNSYSLNKIFKPPAIMTIIESCTDIIISLPQKCDKQSQQILNSAVIEILKVHLGDLSISEPRLFLDMLLNESMRVFLYKSVLQQITIISKKEEDLHKNLEKIKVEQAEQFRLKRQKILNKRKVKDEIMKKNQSQMLNKFKDLQGMNHIDSDKPTCIYCKGQKDQILSLISYVGLTNLIEQTIFKQHTFHYFFTTCGHYIHSSCYQEASSKQTKKHCFLCKQQTNILIPDLVAFPEEKSQEYATEFLKNILSALVNEYDFYGGKIAKFQPSIFEQNEKIVVESFARQLICKGLHSYAYFKKNLYNLYLQIFQLIQLMNIPKLKQIFQQLNQQNHHQNSTKIQLLESYIEQRILNLELEEDYSFLPLTSEQIQQANNILNVIKQRKPDTQIKQLKIINMDTMFIKIPQTLKQLHFYMGKCKLCPNVTNNIFLCLTCGWSGCLRCSKEIFIHVKNQHLQGTAIIGCSTGSVKYVKADNIFEDSSIFENYMGLSFTEADSYNEFTRSEKYNLNLQKQREVKTMMLRSEVNQKIKLNAGYC